MHYVLGLLLSLALLGPLFGADSRDGLDWTPGHFWLPRNDRSRRFLKRNGNRERIGGARAVAGVRPTVPTAG